MHHDRILFLEALDLFSYLPFQVREDLESIQIEYTPDVEALFWKGQNLDLTQLKNKNCEKLKISLQSNLLQVPKSVLSSGSQVRGVLEELNRVRESLLKENLQCKFWKRPQHICASGFKEGSLPRSESLLNELYDQKLIVPEKKKFVVDLWKSTSSYLVADEENHISFLDAASQIASLAIGHNNRVRNALLLRPELQESEQDFKIWDVARGFKRLMSTHSQLDHVYLVNSGAEAMETALRSCQTQHPERRRVLAFEGSFHGRTLLALHTTHSPAKRIPFEIYKDLVSFLEFPEDKAPQTNKEEPEGWLKLWASSANSSFENQLRTFTQTKDPLLESEIATLIQVREEIQKEAPLAVLIEPIQCEGGDRYASARFFRALRILTRAHDVSLVIDEVQSGFGLGGPFFWHKHFKLVDADGNPDNPDALYVAKKAQVGACITRYEMPDFIDETCPASLHRGYLQAVEILENNPTELESKIRTHLEKFCRHIGTTNAFAPRNQGYAFSFELPDAKTLTALISKRFPRGLLFYPAGDTTARFRMRVGIQEQELLEIFSNLFHCFEDLEKDALLKIESSYEKWLAEYPASLTEKIAKPSFETHSIWPEIYTKQNIDKLGELPSDKWDRAFHKVVGAVPQVLHMSLDSQYSLSHPPKAIEDLVQRYQKECDYTRLDLMWDCSRFFGTQLRAADNAFLEKIAPQIDQLQKESYEPARQTLAQEFIEINKHPRAVVHVAFEGDSLLGISGAAPVTLFSKLPMLDRDPEGHDESCLYSYDLTLNKTAQGKGLGFRFKCEQFIEAMMKDCTALKSRNRHPEAKAMARLNLRLSGIVTDVNEKDYGGKGRALYQSLSFRKSSKKFHVGDLLEGSLKNKITLSNFVSRHYIRNTQILAEFLPPDMRHLYYASGRAETADKSLRLLRYFRPQATEALSLEGSYFGQSTACARSLGGPWGHRFFDWPVFENSKELAQFLSSKKDTQSLLGFYAETPDPKIKDYEKKIEDLQKISELCQKHAIPFILAENKTSFWAASKKDFCLAGNKIPCDALLLYAGHQLGVLAVKESLFLDKPLMMISTWDGDEFSLALLKRKLLANMP